MNTGLLQGEAVVNRVDTGKDMYIVRYLGHIGRVWDKMKRLGISGINCILGLHFCISHLTG